MSWNLPFLKPAPHIARLPETQIKRLYPKMRWQIMESTFIGYAIFYLVRNNLPIVTKDIGDALHYSKGQIGDLLAITAITYGVGKFFMGAWSDRSNPRYFMPMGLLLTAFCNFAFGAAHSYPIHLALWGLNGLFQSMGWAPCGRSLGHWYSIRERGTKFAFWNVAQNVGGGTTGFIVAIITKHLGWRSAFYVPGILAVICAIYLIARLRDTPQSVGLPPIEEYRNDYPAIEAKDSEKELGTYDLLVNYILKNPYIWLFAGANFFVYIARYGMLDWGPYYLQEVKHASLVEGGISTTALEFSAIFSTILMGWLSDKLGGRRGMISVFCMIPVFLAYLGIIYSPDNKLWIDLVLFGVIGFFVYPAILLLVVSALDYTSKKAVGTAAGFIGLFGYLGRVTESKGIGALVPRYGWNFALYAIMASAFMGIVLLSWMWKLSPRRAEEIAPPGLSRHSAKNKSDV
ncbi:MAG: MFS transporter [Terracidiphilus sp.]|jgi:OPA family glycerol-3-phosphate transporter-like MFS transporter